MHNVGTSTSTLLAVADPAVLYVSRALSCGIWQDTHFAPPHYTKNVWIGRRARNVLLPMSSIQLFIVYMISFVENDVNHFSSFIVSAGVLPFANEK